MLQVPTSLAALLVLLAPAFSRPSFRTFSMLVVGFTGRVRDCTVTGMLQAAGLVGEWHHSRAHDFFARAKWDPDELGLRLLDLLVERFVGADAPIRLALDDTLFGRSGRKVWGAHYLHDGAQPEGSVRRTRWGNCWVTVVLVIERYPGRVVDLVMDGAYASKAWRGLPTRVTLTTRMRSNAALYDLAPERKPGQQGRPRLKGHRLGSLAQIAENAVFTEVTITTPGGRTRTAHVHEFVCLWYEPLHTRPVKVIVIRNPGRTEGFDIAPASTATAATAAALIARYDTRWTIETAHQEAKANGVGEARNRVQKAVERTVPFGFLCQTITITWYALHGDPKADITARRNAAPWYRQKTTISYTDMRAALRRDLIRNEFWAQAHPTPTHPKLDKPQTPPQSAAA